MCSSAPPSPSLACSPAPTPCGGILSRVVRPPLPALALAYRSSASRAAGDPPRSSGGVILKACEGRIVCDNTLDARVKLVYHERLPVIRSMLFGESVKGVH